MKKFLVCLAAFAVTTASNAQTFSRYIIQFRNKATTPYSLNSPLSFLSQRALDRRTRYGIAVDSTDLPVTPRYLDSLRLAGSVTVLNASRWLNQVSIQTSDAAGLQKINGFPFVQSVRPIAARLGAGSGKTETKESASTGTAQRTAASADYFDYGQSFAQVHMHNGEFLHNIGLRGQNTIIGLFDGGFRSYTSLRAFDSVNANGQVLGTYDFVARETSVVEDDTHGMQCFSIIAANIPGQFVGTAPKASFYLFRSEDGASEYPIEEHNWVCAAERLDSAGGDLVSSSVGYSDGMTNAVFNHAYSEMDGNTTIAARGADMAAKKGIFVANAAGNDAAGFHYISTPADADSVMAVGAVRKDSVVADFSSFGPSADGQIKPDVASVGVATTLFTTGNTVGASNGTSFACPNILGLVACLWQGFPEANNMKILTTLRLASHKAFAPDDRIGYGIPDMKKATLLLLKDFSTATVAASACKNTVSWTSKDIGIMKYEIERKAPGQAAFAKIGERQAVGSSFAARSYQFADSLVNVSAGTVTYRIRQVIDTAAATLSADYIDTVSVNLGAGCITTGLGTVSAPAEEILLLPNPARERFTLKVTTAYPVQNLVIRLTDAAGKLLWVERRSKASGTASFGFPSYALPRGKYFVGVYNGEKLLATKALLKL